MKNYTLSFPLILITFLVTIVGYAQSETITLNALPGGTEGTTVFTDSSTLNIDASGVVSYNNSNSFDDWGVSATTITASGALNKTFAVLIGGMASVDQTEGNNYGKKILEGGIDRASDGAIGIRGGVGNGIDINEGLYFGLDLTNISSSASLQITKIYVTLAGSVNESGVIVSRLNPSERIIFGNSATPGVNYPVGNGVVPIDISSFNVYLQGGAVNNDLIALFNNSPAVNNIRITGIELKFLTNILNTETIINTSHPRLLLKAGEEALIQTLINTSPEHLKSHNYIIATADSFLLAAPIVKPTGTRILAESQDAIEQIFFLSYAYRMTNEIKYLNKAETVMNDVCNWDNWITYSLDTCEMTFAVAIGYDWLFDGLSAATKQKAREKILNYGFLTQKNKAFWNSTSNWNQVCIGALSCAALAIYGDGTTQMNTEAAFVINNILVKNPNSMNTYGNGNYPEGPMYWSYGTTYEVLMLSALEGVYGKNHEGINRLIATPGFLESAEFMQYVTGPTSLYFNYSDSTAKRIPLPATLWMAEKANKPSLLSEEKKLMQNGSYTKDFDNRRFLPLALIYGKNISLDNLPDPQAKVWTGYGDQPIVMARTAWQGSTGKYLGLKGGTPTYSHAQMDGGFFVYDSQGIRWGMDFGKYDYDAQGEINGNDFLQNSERWDIFRVSNLSQNTISIKKATETSWQHHKVDGAATIDEVYDIPAKRGGKVNMKSLIGLNNELQAVTRSAYLVDESYLEIKDYLSNGAEPINLYWNMVTKAIVETVSPSKIKLTQGGKTVILEIVSSNPSVSYTLVTNRSTDPVFYNPTATADSKNPGTVMIGFEASIPANNEVTFTVTIKDDAEVPPSSVEPINNIVLDLPNPTTGLEGNLLYSDTSEFNIDSNGEVTIGGESINYAWSVYGDTNLNSADNSKFFFRWKGMGTTNINQGVNYGALLTQAGMDRASTGELGVRGGAGAGIDPNEGFNLGFDFSYLPNTVQLQLVKVGVSEITGTENGVIVNRKDTTKRMTFGGSSSTASVKFSSGKGDVNVESLGITITGGETNYDLASLFNPASSGSFRMNKFVFKLLTPSYSIAASASGNGAVTGTGTYQAGSTATLIATPSAGNSFLKWTDAGNEVSTNATYTFTVTEARALVANFVPLITITSCNSYIWNGIEYTTTGLYTGTTVSGQIQKLNLTIIPVTTLGSESVSACGSSYVWALNGQTYNASGNYTHVVGCNTATLSLTLTPSTTNGSETISQCGGTYTWPVNSVTYSASTTEVVTVGCNTATLNLTITAPTTNGSVTQVQTGGTYIWAANGQTYTTSGVYTHVVGCNTATLDLTINTAASEIPATFPAFCKGATVATATGTTSMKFYSTLTGGLPLAGTTALATGKTLFVTEVVNSVESSPRVPRLITVNVIPATPASMATTDAVLCKYVGTTNTVTYTVAPVATATSYLWSVPAGMNVIADASATDNVITVNFLGSPLNNISVGGLGTISARAVNSFDCPSAPRSLVLTAKLPTAPTSLTMTSADTTDHFNLPVVPATLPATFTFSSLADLLKITKVGPYMGTSTVFTLTAPAAPTAASYAWTLPSGATQLSGGTSNIITVDFAGVPAGIGSLPIVVKSAGGCGLSTARTLTLGRTVPGAPTALTLTNSSQSNLSSLLKITKVGPYTGTNIQFTLTATPFLTQGATSTSYAWILPSGVTCETANTPTFVNVTVPPTVEGGLPTIVSVPAISTPTNVITVNFNGATGIGNLELKVFGVNGAGNSIARKLVLARALPTAPTALVLRDGATVVTKVGPYVGESTSLTLTATPFLTQGAEATSFTWTLPAGVNVTSGATEVSNNGTTKTWTSTGTVLTIDFDGVAPAVFSLPLSVQAVNGAGTSSATRTLTVTSAAPTTPGSITTPTLAIPTYNPACPGTTTITVQVPSVFGVTYTWTVGGTEALITGGQGTNSITIDVEAVTTTTLAISVVGSNGTGISPTRALTIKKVGTCRIAPESTTASKFSAKAYPNPSSSEFTIETSAKGAMSVKVYDMQGRLVEKADTNRVGSRLAAGAYNVIVNQGANTKTLRVIKK